MSTVVGFMCMGVGFIISLGGRSDIGVLWYIHGALWFIVGELEKLNKDKNK